MKHLFKFVFTLVVLFSSICSRGQQPLSSEKFKREFLEHVNHVRAKGCTCGVTYMAPAAPLTWNEQLEIAALGHAQDMAYLNYFSHTSKDGRTMQNRIAHAGYVFKGFRSYMIGENIAMGQMSIAEVMDGWIKSPGHCKNLMNPLFKEIGVARFNDYWVQDFGGRESFSAREQEMIKSGKYRVIEKN